MNDRKYPEKLLANTIAEEQALEIKRQIQEKKSYIFDLENDVLVLEKKLETTCPHLNTKKEHGEISGDYYNKGTYFTVENCFLCGKEISRVESPSSYG